MYTTKQIILNLIKKNITISVAESCTGGLITHSITKISGVSKIFSGGIICYSNKAKTNYLNISKDTLSKYGAVSSQVAKEMIDNLYKIEKTSICISTTGIAGPNGGTTKKPVGLIFIGIRIKNSNHIFEKKFKGTRIQIQRKAKDFIFKKINQLI